MRRFLLVLALVGLMWAAAATPLWAQVPPQLKDSGPDIPQLPAGWCGPGYYLNWLKMLACWLVFLLWVRTTDWVSSDAQTMKMDFLRWNPIVFGTFVIAFVLVWMIPIFWVSFPLLLVAYLAPLTSYIVYRNSKVMMHEKVLTGQHLRYVASIYLKKIGIKIDAEIRDPHETGPAVILAALGGATSQDDGAHLLAARQCPGFRDARQVTAEGLERRSDAIMLDYTPEAVAVRFLVDGVWHPGESLPRATGDSLLEAMKALGGMNPQDRQRRQDGKFSAKFHGANYAATLTTQGTKTGERAAIQFERAKTKFNTLEELGMRPKMQEQLREYLQRDEGFVLLAAPPANGLRTTTNVALRSCDRLLREFVTVEEEKTRYEEIENVPVHLYQASEGKSPVDALPDLFLMEPNVVLVRDLVNAATVNLLVEEIARQRLIVATVRAKEASEAILRVLALEATAEPFLRNLQAVLCQRLVRKLCEHCKEAYQPAPEVLRQLGIPPDRVQVFYRPPQQPQGVCEHCKGIGYMGRTAIFELLALEDTTRQALLQHPRLELVRQTARRAGHRGLQEEGLVLVAKGVTALPELMRVLK